jgi:uncharacterized protein (TIGR02246 family)
MQNALVVTATVALLIACAPSEAGEAEDAAAIRSVVEGIYDGFNRGDAAAIAALCDDDLDSWLTGKQGRVAVVAWISEMVPATGASGSAREAEELGLRFLTPEVAIQKSRRELAGAASGSETTTQLFLRIFVKRDGSWRLAGFFPAPDPGE